MMDIALDHLKDNDRTKILTLLAVSDADDALTFRFKFDLFCHLFFSRYFTSPVPDFHPVIIEHMRRSYYGEIRYLNLGFRGCAKTSLTKLFLTFVILNDRAFTRKYIKVMTRNMGNARQLVTDVYNNIVTLKELYGDIFVREGDKKREETMGAFTTVDQRKVLAGTIGVTQRGHLQDAYRPDWIIFDDVEDRESIQSLAQTEATINRIDEAISGLSADGSWMCNGNYISEEGVIQWFFNKPSVLVDKIPIMREDGSPTWPERYDKEKIRILQGDAEDFWGEYMADPSRSDSSFFDRSRVDADLDACKQPTFESAGVKYWDSYQPHHKYGIGADTSEGIGKDANTFALWDFGTFDGDVARLVGTYFNNRIPPDLFGHELVRVGREFGNCIIAPENNNTGHATIATMRGYPNIYTERKEGSRTLRVSETFGWRTTRKSKPAMLFEFRKDYNDGKIKIYDKNVLKEMRSYTTADLTDTKVGLVTRHFDLFMACFVKGTMVLTNKGQRPIESIRVGDKVMTRNGYKQVTANIAHPKEVITNIGLTGTPDHPVFVNGGIKDLSQVRHGDTITVWNESKRAIENMSYTEAQNIIGTPTHHTGIIEFISQAVQPIKSLLNTFIGSFGKNIMDLFQKVIVFIIKTAILLIIAPITWSVFLIQHTCVYTWRNLKEKRHCDKTWSKIEKRSIRVYEKALKPANALKENVNGVMTSLKQSATMRAFVRAVAPIGHKVNIVKNHSKRKLARCVGYRISLEYPTKNIVGQNALKTEGESVQTVYNLQVEGSPEYFANNILVHNCAIGYQMRKYATFTEQYEEIEEDEPLFHDIGI